MDDREADRAWVVMAQMAYFGDSGYAAKLTMGHVMAKGEATCSRPLQSSWLVLWASGYCHLEHHGRIHSCPLGHRGRGDSCSCHSRSSMVIRTLEMKRYQEPLRGAWWAHACRSAPAGWTQASTTRWSKKVGVGQSVSADNLSPMKDSMKTGVCPSSFESWDKLCVEGTQPLHFYTLRICLKNAASMI